MKEATVLERAMAVELNHLRKPHAKICTGLLAEMIDHIASLEKKLDRYDNAEVVGAQFQDSEGKWFPFLNQAHQQRTIESGECKIRYLIAKPTKGDTP